MRDLSAALSAVAGWLVEPAVEVPVPVAAPVADEPEPPARPVVAVAGLRRRVGVTTVARAIGGLLAAREPSGACVVTCAGGGGSVPLGLPAATRLGRRLEPLVGVRPRACGRLCLVDEVDPVALCRDSRRLAPVVLDIGDPARAAAAASLADHVVMVAGPESEPSLAAVVAESLAVVGPAPVIVLNRAGRASRQWDGSPHVPVPETRIAAQLAGAGREPRGPFGDALGGLVDRWADA